MLYVWSITWASCCVYGAKHAQKIQARFNKIQARFKAKREPKDSQEKSLTQKPRVSRRNARRNALSPKTKGQLRVIAFLEVGCAVEEQVGCAIEAAG